MAAVRIVSQNSVLHIKWCRWLLAFLSFLVSQTTNEANHYFFSWSNLNTKDWNQGYKKDFHFEVLPCFWEKASRRISQAIGGVQRIWEEFHSVPPACTQVWEFQSQVTNTRTIGGLCICNGFLKSDLSSRCCFRTKDLTLRASCSLTLIHHLLLSMSRGP